MALIPFCVLPEVHYKSVAVNWFLANDNNNKKYDIQCKVFLEESFLNAETDTLWKGLPFQCYALFKISSER